MKIDWVALLAKQAGRFWSKVDRGDGCWEWTAGADKDGYGKFAITAPRGVRPKQRHVRAHRAAWMIEHGKEFPAELVTLHACDNPKCVRPDHLRAGTQAENRKDCGEKGRDPVGDRNGARLHPASRSRGSAHSRARFTEAGVLEMRRLRAGGATQQSIADRFGTSQAVVSGILAGKTWRHV